MAFSNLTSEQKKFLAKYLSTGRVLAQRSVLAAKSAKATSVAADEQDAFKKELTRVVTEAKALNALTYPDKKIISVQITQLLKSAAELSKKREHRRAENALRDASARIRTARAGVDANAATDIKPADIAVMMQTPDGIRQLDSMISNLSDDVPEKVIRALLRARLGLGTRILQSSHDRETGMIDKAKHGAMLDTASPKLKRVYREVLAELNAEKP